MRCLSVTISVFLFHIWRVCAEIPNVKETPLEPLEARIAAKVKEVVENQTKALRLDVRNGIRHLKMEMTNNFDLFFSQLNEQAAKLTELSTRLKRVDESMVQVSARVSSLESQEKARLSADDAARKSIASLTSIVVPVKSDVVRMSSQLTIVGRRVKALSRHASLSSSEHRHLNSTIQTMTSAVHGITAGINAARRRCGDDLTTSKTQTARLKSLDSEVRTITPAIESISAQMARVSSKIQGIDGIKSRIDSQRTFISNQCRTNHGNHKSSISPQFHKQDVLLVDSPTCTRFNRVKVPTEAAAGIDSFRRLKDIPDIHHCSNVCAHNHKCLGFWYAGGECKLFHKSRKHVESVSTTLVDIWLLHNGGLGQCSKFFNIKYRTSKYRMVAKWTTWEDAKSTCQFHGGKLAELTSMAEIHALSRAVSTDDSIFVGGIQTGGDEPAGGWMWYQSRIRIPSNGFRWASGQPSNMIFYDEDALYGTDPRRNRFHDARYEDKYQFLCECYPLTW